VQKGRRLTRWRRHRRDVGPGEEPAGPRRSPAIPTFSRSATSLLAPCYQTVSNHAAARRTSSVPSVEIFEHYIVVGFGGDALVNTLNQRVRSRRQARGPAPTGSRVVPTSENRGSAARGTPGHHPSESRALASSFVSMRGSAGSLLIRSRWSEPSPGSQYLSRCCDRLGLWITLVPVFGSKIWNKPARQASGARSKATSRAASIQDVDPPLPLHGDPRGPPRWP